jgi:hypothetical protein
MNAPPKVPPAIREESQGDEVKQRTSPRRQPVEFKGIVVKSLTDRLLDSAPYTEVLLSPFFGFGMYTQVLLIGKTTVYQGSFDRIPVYYLYSEEYILGGRQSPTLPKLSLTTSYTHFVRSRYRSFAVASARYACSKLARKINGLSHSQEKARVS